MTTLLIGLGNPDRRDDGVGLAVARRALDALPVGLTVAEETDPTMLADLWRGYDDVVVVDALHSGRRPGTVLTLDVAEHLLPAGTWAAGGTHAMGLAAVVELDRVLDRLPPRLVVVGVEADDTGLGRGLSPAVAGAVEPALDAALAALGVDALAVGGEA